MPKADTVKTSAKAKKDPNAPKKPLSSYFLFAAEQRASIKAGNPKISFGEIGKLCGEQWKTLSETEKAKYVKVAEEQKAAYEIELAEYIKKNPDSIAAQPKEKKTKAKSSPKKKTTKSKKESEDEVSEEDEEDME